MPPSTARHRGPGFLFYYDEDVPAPRRGRLAANAVRAATIGAVLVLVTLLSLALGPAMHPQADRRDSAPALPDGDATPASTPR
ncbi:hypothetical protein GCM10023085_55510 [Actinomadura viridis]|uniref:Uncharacterized protein n=1 Tax=Actinomadura viridis TaxID=58110 RepID=A0A931GNL0_9ACTN|nr:hypothetical protein [Actinomadura viridis]MBG6086509.1 hypothetical protein [Actinomadura viridis]